ncbi:MAG: phage tail tube protein [Anaplasma sp.]
MLTFKYRDRSGKYASIQGIRSVKLTLRNRNSEVKSVSSQGWKSSLECAGDKSIVIKIVGIVSGSSAEADLLEYSFENRAMDCVLSFEGNRSAKIIAKCFIELYEGFCEAGSLDNFNTTLVSSGPVRYHEGGGNAE